MDLFDIQLPAKLHTLRHLPEGTPVGQPDDPDERAVLLEALRLSDEADVVAWLARRRSREVSHIALGSDIAGLASAVVSGRQLSERGMPVAPDTARLIAAAGRTGWPCSGAEPREVRGALHSLRRYTEFERATRRWAEAEGCVFLLEVLSSRAFDHPVSHVARVLPHEAAQEALARLVAEACPPPLLVPGDAIDVVPLARRLRSADRALRVRVDRIVRHIHGFAVVASCSVRERRAASPRFRQGGPSRFRAETRCWSGFESARDDLGNEYLPLALERSDRGGGVWRRKEATRGVYYPAIVREASKMRLSSSGYRVLTQAVDYGTGRDGEHAESLNEVPLTVDVALPTSAN